MRRQEPGSLRFLGKTVVYKTLTMLCMKVHRFTSVPDSETEIKTVVELGEFGMTQISCNSLL